MARFPLRPLVVLALPAAVLGATLHAACGSGTANGGSGGTGGGGSGGASGGTGGTAGSGGAGGSTAGAGGVGGLGGAGGVGGAGGSVQIPPCDMKPANVPQKTIHDLWADDPAQQTEVWLAGVYVTAVSKAACVAGEVCQFFLQDAETYPDLATGAQHGIRAFVSQSMSPAFAGLLPGDRVDVRAFAMRNTANGQNELALTAVSMYPGCAKKVGSGTPTPVTVTLDELSVNAYEVTTGPLLVRVEGVSGKPALPDEIFGLWKTGTFNDAGIQTVTSLSPYFLANAAFVGLTQGKTHDFTAVTGVFGLFVEPNTSTKYEVIYPRQMSEVEIAFVQP